MRITTFLMALGLLGLGACASGGIGGETGEQPDPGPGPEADMTPDGCLGEQCSPGRFVCVGQGEIHVCRQQSDGCTAFILNESCLDGRVCVEALCVDASGCIDADGDQHGLNCPAGSDCDDNDGTRHTDAPELCDGTDNDCDGIEDEGGVCDADCSGQQCAPGQTQCANATAARECQRNQDGCGVWGPDIDCGGACLNGTCQDDACTDNDGDLRGNGCPFGGDCDDNNPDRYQGNTELCDGLDNDCDNIIDEDFPEFNQSCTNGRGVCEATGRFACAPGGQSTVCDATPSTPSAEICGNGRDENCNGQTDEGFETVGQSCTAGEGACERNGQIVCDGDSTTCNATPGQGTNEICDGQDNDCDGQTDEGGVCSANCVDDSREPDQRSSLGAQVGRGQSVSGTLCGSQAAGSDWIQLGNYNAGERIDIAIEFTSGDSFMHLEVYDPNFDFVTGSSIQSTGHTLSHTAGTSGDYLVWIFPNTNPEPGIQYTFRHNN